MKGLVLSFLMAAALVFAISGTANAVIVNLGADIYADGTYGEVPFFSGNAYGLTLLSGEDISLILDTAAVFGFGIVDSAELFIDGVFVEPGDSSDVIVQAQLLGPLQDVAIGSSERPVITGGRELDPGQQDGSFFDLDVGDILADLSTDNTFQIFIENTGNGSFRVDGLNIQGNVEPIPEPATMILFGSGLLGLAALRRKRS